MMHKVDDFHPDLGHTDGCEIMRKICSAVEEELYCFLYIIHQLFRSQGRKIDDFDPN